MTDLVSRPIKRVEQRDRQPARPLAPSAAVAAGWSAGVGLIVCIVTSVAAWFAADTGSFGAAIKIGATGWLVGNGAGLQLGGVSLTAVPLGFVWFSAWLLHRGGRWAGAHSTVRSLSDIGVGAGVMAGVYAAVAVVAFAVTRSDDVHTPFFRTLLVTALLGGVAGGLGLLAGAGRRTELFDLLPEELRAALAGGLSALLVMVAAGALVVTGSLVVHFSSALTVAEGLHAGLVGGAVIALVGIAMAPNAVLCGAAFVAGPGFAVGSGTLVAPGDVQLGSLPAFPLLAALPRDGADAWWQAALIGVPVLAGAVAGLLAIRRFPVFGLDHAALRGALAGLTGAAGFGALLWLATGSVGPGRMQEVGPLVGPTVLVCAIAFLVGGAVAAVGSRLVGDVVQRRRIDGAAMSDADRDDAEVTVPIPAADDVE